MLIKTRPNFTSPLHLLSSFVFGFVPLICLICSTVRDHVLFSSSRYHCKVIGLAGPAKHHGPHLRGQQHWRLARGLLRGQRGMYDALRQSLPSFDSRAVQSSLCASKRTILSWELYISIHLCLSTTWRLTGDRNGTVVETPTCLL